MIESAVIDHCYRIDADNYIVHIDDRFRSFAVANDAPHLATNDVLGRDLFDYILGDRPDRPFVAQRITQTANPARSPRPARLTDIDAVQFLQTCPA